jgi:hypothetical protein
MTDLEGLLHQIAREARVAANCALPGWAYAVILLSSNLLGETKQIKSTCSYATRATMPFELVRINLDFLDEVADLATAKLLLRMRAVATHWGKAAGSHGFPDAVPHEPRGFEGDAKGAVKLVRADALFGRANQMHRLKPQMQRDVARFEHGPHLHGKWLAALVALVKAHASAFASHLRDTVKAAAMRADWAVRPKRGLDKGESRFFILKMFGGENGVGHGLLLWPETSSWGTGMSSIRLPPRRRAADVIHLFVYAPKDGLPVSREVSPGGSGHSTPNTWVLLGDVAKRTGSR